MTAVRRLARRVAAPAAVTSAAALVGRAAAGGKMQAVGARALALGIPVIAASPAILSTVAFPSVMFLHRVNIGGLDLSYADLTLLVVSAAIMRAVPWHLPLK